MSKTIMEQAGEFRVRYVGVLAISYLDDFDISPTEQKRLDAIKLQIDQIDQKVKDLSQEAQKKLDKAMKDVVAKLRTDASQLKAFQDAVKALSPDVQIAAVEVLNTLYASPRPADPKAEREQIRKALGKFPDHSMAVGKALNSIGVYLPNLKEESPGAEDATARIKKIHVSGDFDAVQVDYVRSLILQAKKQGFKVVVQIERGKYPIADLNKLFATKTGIAEADLPKYLEFLEADKDDYIWSEDNKWLSVDGTKIHASPDISDRTHHMISAFTGQAPSKAGDPREGHHSRGRAATDPPDDAHPGGMVPEGSLQGAVDHHEYGGPWWSRRKPQLSADALGKATGKTVIKNRTYNEGGNMLVGTKPDGQPYAMIGRDGLLMSMFHIQEEFANETDPAKQKAHEFSPDNVKARRDEMDKKGFDPDELAATKARLEHIYTNPPTIDPPPPASAPADIKTAYAQYKADFDKAKKQYDQEQAEFNKDKDEFTKRFLAKMDITKDIFAKDTQIPRKDLMFIPQPEFHIDMHMRPLAPGQVILNDFGENIKLIDEALKLATTGSWEEKQLKSMRDNAVKSQKAMEPVIREIEKQLKAGGLEVIPAPGVMEGDMDAPFVADPGAPADTWPRVVADDLGLAAPKSYTRDELGKAYKAKFAGVPNPPDIIRTLDDIFTRHANFMNAIPGTKEGTNEQYYMTNSTSIGPLRKAYEAYLKTKGVESVEWMGDTGGGRSDRNASEMSLQLSGGLDCRENH